MVADDTMSNLPEEELSYALDASVDFPDDGSPPPRLPPATREGIQLEKWLGIKKRQLDAQFGVHGKALVLETSKEPLLWSGMEDSFPCEAHFVNAEQQPHIRSFISSCRIPGRQRAFSRSSGGERSSASDAETVNDIDDLVSCCSDSSVERARVLAERHQLDRRMPSERLRHSEEWGVRDPESDLLDFDCDGLQARRANLQHADYSLPSPFFRTEEDSFEKLDDGNFGAPVTVHVYDFHEFTKKIGLPVFHLTVEVYKREYFFSTNGVISCTPGSHGGHMLRESVIVGRTQQRPSEVNWELSQLSVDWPASSYSFIGRNCQGFAAVLCQKLGVGSNFPTRFLVSGALPAVPGCCVSEHRQQVSGCCVPEHRQRDLTGSESPRRPLSRPSGICSCIGSGSGGVGDLDGYDFCQPRDPNQDGLGIMHPPRRAIAAV